MAEERRDGVQELKFPVAPGALEPVLGWLRSQLAADPHGGGEFGDVYDVRSLYLDTPAFDVYHRRGSFGRAKFRLRCYGDAPVLFLERKLKRDGVVRKRRVTVDPEEIGRLGVAVNGAVWPGAWFHHRLAVRGLRPVVMMNYRRVARWGVLPEGVVRVTLDRELRAVPASSFEVPGRVTSPDLFESGGVLEVKFSAELPFVVRTMVAELKLQVGGFSKYRMGVSRCGLVAGLPPEDVTHGQGD